MVERDAAVGVEHRHQRLVETAFLDRAVGALLADQRERVDGFAVDAFDGGDGVAAHALVRLWMERIERGVAGTHAERLDRSEEHTSELQSLMRISYAVFCLKKKKNRNNKEQN